MDYAQESSPLTNNYTWSIKSVKFDFDCGYIYLTYGAPLNKVSILYHDKTKFLNQILFPVQVYTAVPVDEKKWMMAVFFANNSAVFFNVTNTTKHHDITLISPMPFLFQKNFTHVSNQDPFSRQTSMFYVATDAKTQVYNLQCPSGVKLGMGLCLDTFDAAIQQNSKSQQLKFIFTAMKVMAFVIALTQMTPFAGFFLRFINFWNICSIYSLVDVPTVEPLTSILYGIYGLINVSLFNLMGIDLKLSITSEYKVTDKYISQYQISSNFVGIILEPAICTFFMCIIFYAFEWINYKFFSEENKKKVNVSKFRIFFGQYVSFLSIFMFPLKFIYLSSNQNGYREKLNSVLNLIFIFSGLVITFGLIQLNGKKFRNLKKQDKNLNITDTLKHQSATKIEKPKTDKFKVQFITFKNIEFAYVCLVNIIMPILGTITNPYWFAVICGILIILGIAMDSERPEWRINAIIMNVEIMMFHIFFCLHLANLSQRGRYIISVITTVTIMIGAVHEIFTLIVRICMDIYLKFFQKSRKVGDEKSEVKKLKRNLQKNQCQKVPRRSLPS